MKKKLTKKNWDKVFVELKHAPLEFQIKKDSKKFLENIAKGIGQIYLLDEDVAC